MSSAEQTQPSSFQRLLSSYRRLALRVAYWIINRYEPRKYELAQMPNEVYKMLQVSRSLVRDADVRYGRGIDGRLKRDHVYRQIVNLHPHLPKWYCALSLELAVKFEKENT